MVDLVYQEPFAVYPDRFRANVHKNSEAPSYSSLFPIPQTVWILPAIRGPMLIMLIVCSLYPRQEVG